MALLLQLYLISMVHYICFIFKSWSTSCYGAGKGWFPLAGLEHVPTARPCWAPVLSTQSVPGGFISHLSSREHSLHLAAVCRGQESCGSGCEAGVSRTLHSRVLSPHSHLKSHDGFCEKKILSVFTTLVIFLFYIWKGNFFDTLKSIQGNFFKNAETVSSWLKMQIY